MVEFFCIRPAQTCIVSTQSIALDSSCGSFSLFCSFNLQVLLALPLSVSFCCSFGFCLSCEQLSSCKFIDSTCGCSLATFVFVRSLISMCKLIKASKSKLKHFAPAADGNSIQLHRLELNRIEEKRRGSVCVLQQVAFVLALSIYCSHMTAGRIINSILGTETKLVLEWHWLLCLHISTDINNSCLIN